MKVTLDLTEDNVTAIAEKVVEIQNKTKIPQEQSDDFYTVKKVALLTGKTENTIARHIRLKILKATKVGKSWLIKPEEYLKYTTNEE